MSAWFLEKLYNMALIPTKWNPELCNKVTASSFCVYNDQVQDDREHEERPKPRRERQHEHVPNNVFDPTFLVPSETTMMSTVNISFR